MVWNRSRHLYRPSSGGKAVAPLFAGISEFAWSCLSGFDHSVILVCAHKTMNPGEIHNEHWKSWEVTWDIHWMGSVQFSTTLIFYCYQLFLPHHHHHHRHIRWFKCGLEAGCVLGSSCSPCLDSASGGIQRLIRSLFNQWGETLLTCSDVW